MRTAGEILRRGWDIKWFAFQRADCLARDDCKLRRYGREYGAEADRFKGERGPFEIDASHPDTIAPVATNVTVNVTNSSDAPVSGARVCLQKGDWQTGEVYEVGTTNGSGNVTLSVNPSTEGTMYVVAWARDHICYQGTITVEAVAIEDDDVNPVFTNSAGAVYPSPAMSIATIPFSLASAGSARVDVYDVTGRIVATLAAEEMAAGQHNLVWNLEDANGMLIPSGVYHVRIVAADWTGTTNLVVTR